MKANAIVRKPTDIDAPYTIVGSFVAIGGKQTITTDLSNHRQLLEPMGAAKELKEISGSGATVPKGEIFQVYQDVTAQKTAALYGAERFELVITFTNVETNQTRSVTVVRDFGAKIDLQD